MAKELVTTIGHTVRRRLNKGMWLNGAAMGSVCIHNMLRDSGIPSRLVSGYVAPEINLLGMKEVHYIPHVWVVVDGFEDPVVDMHSIGDCTLQFALAFGIDPLDTPSIVEKLAELKVPNGHNIALQLDLVRQIPPAMTCLGEEIKPHMDSVRPTISRVTPENVSFKFGALPFEEMQKIAKEPDYPNGYFFSRISFEAKRLYDQVVSKPWDVASDEVFLYKSKRVKQSPVKPTQTYDPVPEKTYQPPPKSPELVEYERFLKKNMDRLKYLFGCGEHELLLKKNRDLMVEYERLHSLLSPDDVERLKGNLVDAVAAEV